MARSSTTITKEYWTPERRAALAQKNRDRIYTPELRAKVAENARHPHTTETRRKMSRTRTGMKYGQLFRETNSRVSREHAAKNLPNCGCVVHGGRPKSHHRTTIENILVKVILKEFPKVITEKRFKRYVVDAYLPPPYHLAFEADGEYWHRMRPEHDVRRDAYLLEQFNLVVIRLSEKELREAVQ